MAQGDCRDDAAPGRLHIGAEAAGFVNQVFSLYDTAVLEDLIGDAGFRDVSVRSHTKSLRLPAQEEFLWQYVYATPLASAVSQADDKRRALLERDVIAMWQQFVRDRGLMLQVRIVVGTGRK